MPNISAWKQFLLLMVLLVAAPAAVQAQPPQRGETTVHVVGSSRVRGGDVSAAREEAINAALVAAVHTVVAEMLPPETVAGSFQTVNEAVFQRTDRFVRDYKMLAQSTVAGTYRALVQASVSTERIKEAFRTAGIRLEARQFPQILFALAESQIHDLAPRYWWDGRTGRDESVAGAALAQAFTTEGYTVVRPAGNTVATGYPPELRGTEAVALGRELKAEVVVVGLAAAEAAGQPAGQTSPAYRGSVSARAYRVSDGQLIAQTQRAILTAGDDAQSASRDALDKAAALAAGDLSAQLDTAWFKQMAAGNRIEIVVHGITGQMAGFVRFRGAIGSVSGVERMQIREMTADAAILNVDYQGNARALADALLLLSFDTFKITVARIEANTIDLQLVPR